MEYQLPENDTEVRFHEENQCHGYKKKKKKVFFGTKQSEEWGML